MARRAGGRAGGWATRTCRSLGDPCAPFRQSSAQGVRSGQTVTAMLARSRVRRACDALLRSWLGSVWRGVCARRPPGASSVRRRQRCQTCCCPSGRSSTRADIHRRVLVRQAGATATGAAQRGWQRAERLLRGGAHLGLPDHHAELEGLGRRRRDGARWRAPRLVGREDLHHHLKLALRARRTRCVKPTHARASLPRMLWHPAAPSHAAKSYKPAKHRRSHARQRELYMPGQQPAGAGEGQPDGVDAGQPGTWGARETSVHSVRVSMGFFSILTHLGQNRLRAHTHTTPTRTRTGTGHSACDMRGGSHDASGSQSQRLHTCGRQRAQLAPARRRAGATHRFSRSMMVSPIASSPLRSSWSQHSIFRRPPAHTRTHRSASCIQRRAPPPPLDVRRTGNDGGDVPHLEELRVLRLEHQTAVARVVRCWGGRVMARGTTRPS
jgi:hypothetical protein